MPRQPWHMVEISPWPITSSLGALMLVLGLAGWMHKHSSTLLLLSAMVLLFSMFQWWRDVSRESTFQGLHTSNILKTLKLGMILFILSEVMFFMGFFWAFFHSSLAPSLELGSVWPPTDISVLNPLGTPLLNTAILLSSGISVTWAHHSIFNFNQKSTLIALTITIMLGFYFTILQASEYLEAPFSIADNVYGSTFFVTTGFHGLHVMIGTLFLVFSSIRMLNKYMSPLHHFGFEAAAWYWHFVDVVWIFLFMFMYWWGS